MLPETFPETVFFPKPESKSPMNNPIRFPVHGFIVALLAIASITSIARAVSGEKPNVLFIPVDDLNHWAGHLGRNPQTKTPNTDRLANMGVTFTNAHCAAPVCNPSRAALLSGMRPGTTGIYDNGQPYESAINADHSLVTQFRNAGYETLGMGKLWHGGLGFSEQWTGTGGRERANSPAKGVLDDHSIGGIKFGILNANDDAVPDTQIADYVIDQLSKTHHALRDDRWRYIRYADGSEELYDHATDPYEWTTLATLPEHAGLKAQLATHFPTVNNPVVESKPVKPKRRKSGAEEGVRSGKQKRLQERDAKPVSLHPKVQRPINVVFFVVDDLGQRDLACYGSSFYETPNLDRLAGEGALFPNAYAACPVCSPTRASIMTGQYPQRTGITDYIGAAQPSNWKRNTPHLPAPYSEHLALEQVTLAESLKAHGYATFFGGKWHLGGIGFLPEDQGFDINLGGLERGGPYGGKKYFSPYGNPKLPDGPDGEHLPDRLATEAANFIDANREKPFFVYLPFYSVHTPLMARPDLVKKYQQKRVSLNPKDVFGDEPPRKVRMTQDHAVYAGMVEAMDQAVGKVIAKLDELKLADDTLVIMTSDNGGLSTSEGSPTSNFPLRAGKGWLYEGGTRVSLIMRLPGVIRAGVVNESQVISPDYFPTILAAAGLPAEPDHHKDGVSHFESMKSGQPSPPRALFWHYPHYGNQGGAPGAAVREGDWKLIDWFDSGTVELFNLATDPGEANNLASQEPERVKRLQELLHRWVAEVGAVSSAVNPEFDAAKPNGRR